jgi:hypothetical protein
VNELFTTGGHQQSWATSDAEVVLLQYGCGLLQTVLKGFGGFELLKAFGPLVLPVDGQPTEGQCRQAQSKQDAGSDPVHTRQEGRLAFHRSGRQGFSQQGRGLAQRSGGVWVAATGLPFLSAAAAAPGGLGLGQGGDHGQSTEALMSK